jgi:hypothetical protein
VPSSLPSAPAADRRRRWTLLASIAAAIAALILYHTTLLPGVDFGDSGSIQTVVGERLLTPRDGYPLYFAIGGLLLKLTGLPPAYVMNLASAIEAAVACGLFVAVAARLSGSLPAALAATTLFAVSYTFWSQAVVAEVYALHIAFVLASILLLLRWQERPTTARLAAFFACYAIGFGNHLSMILLAPAFTIFLLICAPHGWRSLFSIRIVALAVGFAVLGAAQYLWNFRTLWFTPDPPASVFDALRMFWFDVTKSDWRDTMVLNVPRSMLTDHLNMYWFDLRQQFGLAGIGFAVAGGAALLVRDPRRAALVLLVYAANLAFAFGYNVGDTHVFYLPSHVALALLTSVAVTSIGSWIATLKSRAASIAAPTGGAAPLNSAARHFSVAIPAIVLAVYAAARGTIDFPALDRSGDTRPAHILDALTAGLDDRRSILLVDLNWQIANGLSYYTKAVAPQIAAARLRDVLLYAPALIHDNLEAGRAIALTEPARNVLYGSYGPSFEARPDTAAESFDDVVRRVPRGTRYVLCVLKPTRDFTVNRDDLDAALRRLTTNPDAAVVPGDYVAVAGIVGQPPVRVAASDRPFSDAVDLAGVRVRIRMDAWLAADTIRRMGFGHVIAGGRHTLIVERGISFVAFDDRGEPIERAYFAGIFARPTRYLIAR